MGLGSGTFGGATGALGTTGFAFHPSFSLHLSHQGKRGAKTTRLRFSRSRWTPLLETFLTLGPLGSSTSSWSGLRNRKEYGPSRALFQCLLDVLDQSGCWNQSACCCPCKHTYPVSLRCTKERGPDLVQVAALLLGLSCSSSTSPSSCTQSFRRKFFTALWFWAKRSQR